MDDRRRKIHPDDHAQIKRDYQELNSQRKTAKLWNVSKRTIQFILNPEKRIENVKKRNLRGGSQIYYNKYGKKKWQDTMRKHRARKRKLKLTDAKTHRKPPNAEPIPHGYLTARQASKKYHARQDTIKKYLKPHHFPSAWLYPLFKEEELEEWNRAQRTPHQLSRIKG